MALVVLVGCSGSGNSGEPSSLSGVGGGTVGLGSGGGGSTVPGGGGSGTLGGTGGGTGMGSGGSAALPMDCTPPASSTLLAPIVSVTVGVDPPLTVPLQERPYFVEGSTNTANAEALLNNFTESEWRALVPRQSPRDQGIVCPADGSTAFTWSANTPNQIICGGQTYSYGSPTGSAETIEVLSGDMVSIPVWNVSGGGTSKLGMLIDRRKAFYLYDQLEVLASAYAGTLDDKYARRIAITFDEWAKYLPHYVLTGVNTTNLMTPSERDPIGGPYGRYQRLSDHNALAHELKGEWVVAMDAIFDADSMWDDLDGDLGYDVKQFILDDLILNHLDYILNQANFNAHLNVNLSFPYTQTARWATVLGRPEIIEWLNDYLTGTVRNLLRDGMHAESMSYSRNYLSENLTITDEMVRFFEVWPSTAALDPIQARLLVHASALQKGLDAISLVRLPDGNIAPFGNTSFFDLGMRTEATSEILPGYGHITLGAGENDDQTQINLAFNDRGNHCEGDVLSFTLHDSETEMLGDIRDSRMAGRSYTESTVAHNTVVLNRTTQSRSNHQSNGALDHLFTGGDVYLFEPHLDGISVAEVDGRRSYLNVADRYQRLMILNAKDTAHPYVVDLFRVKGGTVHDYFLHGSTRWDSVTPPTTTSLTFAPMAGTYPLLEGGETWDESTRDEFYGAFRDVRRADSTGEWNVTFEEASGERGSRIFMVDDGTMDIYVSKSPSPFRTGSPNSSDPDTFYAYWRPTLMARHSGPDTLFAAVIEPLDGPSSIVGVERIGGGSDLERVALRIDFADGRHDVVLANLTDPDTGKPASGALLAENGADTFSLTGHVGVWSTLDGAVLVGGSEFVHPNGTLVLAPSSHEGTITGATRAVDGCGVDALVTDAALPEGAELAGRFVRATFGTYDVKISGSSYPMGVEEQSGFTQMYQIERVVTQDGKTYIVLTDDPALQFENGLAVETKRPYRTFSGPVSFEILLSRGE